MNRVRISIVAVAAGAVAAAVVLVWARGVDAEHRPAHDGGAVATVEVIRTDLSTSRSLRGSLGFGVPRPVKSGREGVVTWLPTPGTAVRRGEVLFRLNDEAVPLFTGSPPLFRTLSERNTVGRDVAMVVENLKALGYSVGTQPRAGERVTGSPSASPATVTVKAGEGVLTSQVITALKKWQRDRGLPEDGRLDVGDVAVLPGAVRVDAVASHVGDAATGTLMTVTSTTKVVTVQAPVAEVDFLREGDAATVRLPSGTELPGTVGAIATVAAQQEGAQGGTQTLAVTVNLANPDAAGPLDGAEATVTVAGETRTGVLAVPVNALLALREGGYALQLPDGTLIAVTTGLFSRGLVEVTGDGVRAGLRVVTTS
jgi:hypothetical protein